VLDDGCEKFSSADGIVFMGFAKGFVSAAFEKIRETLSAMGFSLPGHK
jgi:hypothetical protein